MSTFVKTPFLRLLEPEVVIYASRGWLEVYRSYLWASGTAADMLADVMR